MWRSWIISVSFAGDGRCERRGGIVDREMVYMTWGKRTGELAQLCVWRKEAPKWSKQANAWSGIDPNGHGNTRPSRVARVRSDSDVREE